MTEEILPPNKIPDFIIPKIWASDDIQFKFMNNIAWDAQNSMTARVHDNKYQIYKINDPFIVNFYETGFLWHKKYFCRIQYKESNDARLYQVREFAIPKIGYYGFKDWFKILVFKKLAESITKTYDEHFNTKEEQI